jgi:riboflavin kinase/FMN adenylyltransferase
MRILRHYQNLPAACRGGVAVIGNFDGIHLGHQALIRTGLELAHEAGRRCALLTFEPHPRSVLRPRDPPFRLTPFRIKARLLREFGLDALVALRFDAGLAAKTPDEFVQQVLVDGLGIAGAVVGFDFVFGNKRSGNAEMLTEMGRRLGFAVTVIAPVEEAGGLYSSTRIRDLLNRGEPRRAAALLGRDWEIDGRVESGDRRGRTIGFPTANLRLHDYLRPAAGVYAVRVAVEEEGAWRPGVANFGYRPTFGGTDLKLEVHLFDFSGDLYGKHLRVALVEYLRPERKFAGLQELRDQIAADCTQARRMLDDAGKSAPPP